MHCLTKLKNGQYKNKCQVRLIMSETVSYFQEQLWQESWENVFSTNKVNSSFNKFLSIYLIKLEASFPDIYLSNNRDKGWITQGIRRSSNYTSWDRTSDLPICSTAP